MPTSLLIPSPRTPFRCPYMLAIPNYNCRFGCTVLPRTTQAFCHAPHALSFFSSALSRAARPAAPQPYRLCLPFCRPVAPPRSFIFFFQGRTRLTRYSSRLLSHLACVAHYSAFLHSFPMLGLWSPSFGALCCFGLASVHFLSFSNSLTFSFALRASSHSFWLSVLLGWHSRCSNLLYSFSFVGFFRRWLYLCSSHSSMHSGGHELFLVFCSSLHLLPISRFFTSFGVTSRVLPRFYRVTSSLGDSPRSPSVPSFLAATFPLLATVL